MTAPQIAPERTKTPDTPVVKTPPAPPPVVLPDGRRVRVIHIVAELAPFARSGGLGEAVASLARFQAASGVPAAMATIPVIAGSDPVIPHAHDWHTALAPVYLRTLFAGDVRYGWVSVVLTVHNAGYQGHFPPETMSDLGLPSSLYNARQLEWYGRVNLLKGGLVFADAVTTVSQTHAHELRTGAGGFGLDGVFTGLGDRSV